MTVWAVIRIRLTSGVTRSFAMVCVVLVVMRLAILLLLVDILIPFTVCPTLLAIYIKSPSNLRPRKVSLSGRLTGPKKT